MVYPVLLGSWGPGVIGQVGEVAVGTGGREREDKALATRLEGRVSRWTV